MSQCDNDLLIRIDERVAFLTENFEAIRNKLDSNDEKCSNCKEDLNSKINNRVTSKVFYWVVSGIFGFIAILSTASRLL